MLELQSNGIVFNYVHIYVYAVVLELLSLVPSSCLLLASLGVFTSSIPTQVPRYLGEDRCGLAEGSAIAAINLWLLRTTIYYYIYWFKREDYPHLTMYA